MIRGYDAWKTRSPDDEHGMYDVYEPATGDEDEPEEEMSDIEMLVDRLREIKMGLTSKAADALERLQVENAILRTRAENAEAKASNEDR